MIRSGFEPETHSLEGCCSIQLSYQTQRFITLCTLLHAFARQNTRVGTIVKAHKGNLGTKVLLFFDLCKFKAKKLQKFLKKIIEFLPFLL